MTLRPIFALLIAAAMLFAHFGMQRAMASTPDDHHGQMKANGDCDGKVPANQEHKSTDKPCCAAMCLAVAVEPAPAVEPIDFGRAVQHPSRAEHPDNYLAELPTPPPRRA